MSTSDDDLQVEARGLVRRFAVPGRRRGRGRAQPEAVEAVRGIDLAVRRGEVFGFLGPNGAGKTTTVRMLTTLLPVSAGSARVAGHDVIREPDAVRRSIGVALQEVGLDPNQTGRELLSLQCGLYGLHGSAVATRAVELLELVGLTDAADRRLGTYSGGMKRRLDLATALVHQPSVLFLDEPTTGLDPASRLTVWDEVRRINAEGTTVFLTTQYLEEADQLCERLAIIDDGRLVAGGTPDALKSELGSDVVTVEVAAEVLAIAEQALHGLAGVSRVQRSEAGGRPVLAAYVDDGAGTVVPLVRALSDAGVTPGAVSVARPTLDDVFLRATGRRIEGEGQSGPEPESVAVSAEEQS